MGLVQRLSTVLKAKASKALDKAEDPRKTLDNSYERQLELLTKGRRGVADVATSRKRLELQAVQLKASADKLQAQARQALQAGREDLARAALSRRSGIFAQPPATHTRRGGVQVASTAQAWTVEPRFA